MMTKRELLLKEVIVPYHPTFSKSVDLENVNPEWFDVSLLLEEAMSHVGEYEWVNLPHMDFSDGSDCKSSTVNNRKRGLIDRVISHGGKEKSGMLRVVVYNSISQKIMYYALPKGSIGYGYKIETDTIPKIEEFRCGTFKELCLKKNEK